MKLQLFLKSKSCIQDVFVHFYFLTSKISLEFLGRMGARPTFAPRDSIMPKEPPNYMLPKLLVNPAPKIVVKTYENDEGPHGVGPREISRYPIGLVRPCKHSLHEYLILEKIKLHKKGDFAVSHGRIISPEGEGVTGGVKQSFDTAVKNTTQSSTCTPELRPKSLV